MKTLPGGRPRAVAEERACAVAERIKSSEVRKFTHRVPSTSIRLPTPVPTKKIAYLPRRREPPPPIVSGDVLLNQVDLPARVGGGEEAVGLTDDF